MTRLVKYSQYPWFSEMVQEGTTITVDTFIFFTILLSQINKFKFSCLAHVVNLENIDVMKHITKIAIVENATAIWEYDPSRDDNRILGGSLDVIATIQMLAIKVRFKFYPASFHFKNSHFIIDSGI